MDGMADFSRLGVHAEMWIGWCKFQCFLSAFGAVWRDGDGGLVGFSVARCRFGMSMHCGGSAKYAGFARTSKGGIAMGRHGKCGENESRMEQLSGFERSV